VEINNRVTSSSLATPMKVVDTQLQVFNCFRTVDRTGRHFILLEV